MLKNKKYHSLFSSKKYPQKRGPKGPSKEVINAIVEMKKRNPRMGCPKIALTISNTFDIKIDRNIVKRVLGKHYRPGSFNHGGSSCLNLIGNLKDSLWSVDLFRVESINLNGYWIMIVMDQYTRRIIGFSTIQTNALSGANVCMMFNKIMARIPPPKYMSSDNEIQEIKTILYTPISHPFVERVIGTTRREYLDHILFTNSIDLENKLDKFKVYYNQHRQHLSLKSTPSQVAGETIKKVATLSHFQWKTYCQGLFQVPCIA